MQILPQFTLIGNPLYCTMRDEKGLIRLVRRSSDAGKYIGSNSGEYRDATFWGTKYQGNGWGPLETPCIGSLYIAKVLVRLPRIFGTKEWATINPTSIEELIRENYVATSTYDDFFENTPFEELKEEIARIPEDQRHVHYVKPEGDLRVLIGKKSGSLSPPYSKARAWNLATNSA